MLFEYLQTYREQIRGCRGRWLGLRYSTNIAFALEHGRDPDHSLLCRYSQWRLRTYLRKIGMRRDSIDAWLEQARASIYTAHFTPEDYNPFEVAVSLVEISADESAQD